MDSPNTDSTNHNSRSGHSGKTSGIVIGRHPILEALRAGAGIDKILFQHNISGELIGEIRHLAKDLNVPIQQVPLEKLNGLTRGNHQGIVGLSASVKYMPLEEVLKTVALGGMVPLFVMLDGITDVRNIGGIARSLLCCGAQGMIIPDKGVGALNEEALKSSAGALQSPSLNICRVHSLLKAIDDLHVAGFKIMVSDGHSAKNIYDIDFTSPCCIVLGSEDKGVQPYIAKAADESFKIPMTSNFDSFNVSVSAGIILYEAFKQRSFRVEI